MHKELKNEKKSSHAITDLKFVKREKEEMTIVYFDGTKRVKETVLR